MNLDEFRIDASDLEFEVIPHLKAAFQMAEGEGHALFNYQPWADITLTAGDRFLKKLGYLEGEPTLPAAPDGEGLVEQL